MLLLSFLAGLLSSNSLIALAGTWEFLGAGRNFTYAVISIVAALPSFIVGALLLAATARCSRAIFGG